MKMINYPDTCKIIRRGCSDVAVSKTNENEPCQGDISYVVG